MLPRFLSSSRHAAPFRTVRLLAETLAVVAIGIVAGVVVNQLKASEDRFSVTRDYFKTAKPVDASKAEDVFQFIEHAEMMDVFQSSAYEVGQCIFIDARNDVAFAEKHIPGSYQLDHYFADRYLTDLLPVCAEAERIVVYCNGGKCEDSKLATMDLIENGILADKIFVYLGGVEAWSEDGLPFERGERLSGDITYGDE